jgi:sec-independent protein translocase protein TatA
MFGHLGMPELLVILGIVVLIFGARRIPEIARSMGRGIKEFKKAGEEITSDVKAVIEDSPKKDG